MKRVVVLLAVLLLLFTGCSKPQPTESTAPSNALPTLSQKEGETLDPSLSRPDLSTTPTRGKPLADGPRRPSLHRSDDETEPLPEDDGSTVLFVAQVTERRRYRPSEDGAWTLPLPSDGTTSFGETNPLQLSATQEEDGTVTVQFLSDDCYLQNGRMQRKADSAVLSADDTVYVIVRDSGIAVCYALWLK